MKILFHIVLITYISFSALTGTGCATFAKNLPAWMTGDTSASSDENTDANEDPVAAAAMRLRRPASSRLGSDDDSSNRPWNQRYAPPTAETVSYGMNMNDVASVWGEPVSVDTAGSPTDGNQRWVYYSGLSGRYGMGAQRVVYFENGRVVGWKN